MKTKKGLLVLILLALTFVLGFALTACGEDPPAPEPTSFTVTFNTDEGSAVASQTVAKDGKVVEPVSPTKSGHTFSGWYKDGAYANVWSFATDTVTADTTIYAKWTADAVVTYTVTFVSNCDDPVASYTDVVKDSTIERPKDVFSKEHHTFVGWYADKELSEVWSFSNDTVKKDITLYAKWEAVTYTVTFMDGEIELTSEEITYDKPAKKPNDPTKKGYTFVDWYDAEGKEWDFASKIAGDTKLFAEWEAQKYKVTYITNCDEMLPAIEVAYGEMITDLPKELEKHGYDFKGWFKDGATEWVFDTNIVDEATTLHAKWERATFDVRFVVSKGVTPVPKQEVKYEGYATDPGTPTRTDGNTDAEFLGWYSDAEYKYLWNFTGTKIEQNPTRIYAKWNIDSVYRITFDTQGGSTIASKTVTHGNTIGSVNEPRKQGYVFGGWYTDSSCADEFVWDIATEKVTYSMPLYAKWSLEDMTFEKNTDESYTLKKYNHTIVPSATIKIPATYNDLPVTAIGGSAFNGNTIVETITVEGTNLKTIGTSAFYGCSSLTSLILPNSVTTIGAYAFRGCNSLTSLELPSSVTTIGEWAFAGCPSLTKLVLSNKITTLPGYFIGGSDNIKDFEIPSGVTTIEAYAFPTVPVGLWIPSTVTKVAADAFGINGAGASYESKGGTVFVTFAAGDEGKVGTSSEQWDKDWHHFYKVQVQYGMSTKPNFIADGYLFDVVKINEVDTVTITKYIGAEKIVNVPPEIAGKPVTKIGNSAFVSNTNIVAVYLPDSVTEIGDYAFVGVDELQAVWATNNVTKVGSVVMTNGKIFTNYESKPADWAIADTYVVYNTERPEVIGSYLVGVIGKDVTLLTYFGTERTITLPSKDSKNRDITVVSERALYGTSAQSIIIPDGYTTIREESMPNYVSLVYIPGSVKTIDELAMNGPSNVICEAASDAGWTSGWAEAPDKVTYSASAPIEVNGVYYAVIGEEAHAIAIKDGTTEVNIPSEVTLNSETGTTPYPVTTVMYRFAYSNKEITKVTIGTGVTTIGAFAFQNCSGLTSIVIPASVTTIGTYAFNGCSSLSSIVIPESVTTIGAYAFNGCSTTHLKHTALPDTGFATDWSKGTTAYLYSLEQPTAEAFDNLPESVTGGFWHYAEDGVTIEYWQEPETPAV